MSRMSFSRRSAIKTGISAGFLSAAMAAPGPVRSYLLGAASAQSSLPVGDAANVVVWTYRPDIVSDNLTIWAETNGQPTPSFADIPGVYDYANVIAGKFTPSTNYEIRQFVDIDAQLACIDRIKRMFRIDEGCRATRLLGFGNGVKRKCRLA